MDLWVIAVAAGAGYVAKYLQNSSSSEKESLVKSSSKCSTNRQAESGNLLQQIRDKTCPLRRLARSKAHQDGQDRRTLDMEQLKSDSDSVARMASTIGNVLGHAGMVDDYNILWLSSLPPGSSGRESFEENMEFVKLLRSKSGGNFVRPLRSVQSSLAPKIHGEHEELDEYVYSSSSSSCTRTIRAPLVTDGTHFTSRLEGNSFDEWSNGEEDAVKRDIDNRLLRAPSLDNMDLIELQEQASASQERVSNGAFCLPGSFNSFNEGSPNSMLLFLIGMAIGIISVVVANKREAEKLNERLKQAENLVQDLQEELEMKDKLTVKDLADEGSQPLRMQNTYLFNHELIPSVFETQHGKPEPSETSYGTDMANNKAEDPLLRSKIEAELEAELERLELNMKSSFLERTSDFVELDPQLGGDSNQENLKLDLLRKYYDGSSESAYDKECWTATEWTPPANYAVSPRELSIRLHELIESTLEARIKELEAALQNSQSKLQSFELHQLTSEDFMYSEGEFSATPESPVL